jgi:hypothetical protein
MFQPLSSNTDFEALGSSPSLNFQEPFNVVMDLDWPYKPGVTRQRINITATNSNAIEVFMVGYSFKYNNGNRMPKCQ